MKYFFELPVAPVKHAGSGPGTKTLKWLTLHAQGEGTASTTLPSCVPTCSPQPHERWAVKQGGKVLG